MVIIKETKISRNVPIREASQALESTWDDFVSDILAQKFVPNNLEIMQTITSGFSIDLRGTFTTRARRTSIEFSSNGTAITVISIRESDVINVLKGADPRIDYYRLTLKGNLMLIVSKN